MPSKSLKELKGDATRRKHKEILRELRSDSYRPGPELLRFVYRAIRSDEYDPNSHFVHLRARGESGCCNKQCAVENGSSPSPFIHTTKCFFAALYFARYGNSGKVVKLDLLGFPGKVIDISQNQNNDLHGTAELWASTFSEVLLECPSSYPYGWDGTCSPKVVSIWDLSRTPLPAGRSFSSFMGECQYYYSLQESQESQEHEYVQLVGCLRSEFDDNGWVDKILPDVRNCEWKAFYEYFDPDDISHDYDPGFQARRRRLLESEANREAWLFKHFGGCESVDYKMMSCLDIESDESVDSDIMSCSDSESDESVDLL